MTTHDHSDTIAVTERARDGLPTMMNVELVTVMKALHVQGHSATWRERRGGAPGTGRRVRDRRLLADGTMGIEAASATVAGGAVVDPALRDQAGRAGADRFRGQDRDDRGWRASGPSVRRDAGIFASDLCQGVSGGDAGRLAGRHGSGFRPLWRRTEDGPDGQRESTGDAAATGRQAADLQRPAAGVCPLLGFQAPCLSVVPGAHERLGI